MSAPRTLIALLLCASSGWSQRLFVDADASPGGQGSSWADALDDLQPALQLARSDPSISEVWVAEGRYLPSDSGDPTRSFVVPDGLALYGGFDGTETLREQRRPALHPTILDGDLAGDDLPGFVNYGDNSRTVVSLEFVGPATRLDGFTVRGGSGVGAVRVGGSGLRILQANPTLANLVVRENTTQALDGGGGVYAIGTPGVLRIARCSFLGNASANEGAGLRLESAQVVFEDCLFEANQSTDGGGIYLEACQVEVVRCVFRSNSATSGAGIYGESNAVQVAGSEFSRNSATSGAGIDLDGGSLHVQDCSFLSNTGTSGMGITSSNANLTVQRCRFENNRGTTGGGIDVGSSAPGRRALIEDCAFLRNRACSAGGIHARTDTPFRIEVRRCLFDGNRTTNRCGLGRGGTGVSVLGSGGNPTRSGFLELVSCVFLHNRNGQFMAVAQAEYAIRSCTFADVTSNGITPEPAIVTQDGRGRLENSILWGNDPDQVQGATNLVVAWSNVRNDGTVLPGPGNLHVDPAFVDAANGDVHLAPGSPCIDAAHPAEGAVAADFEGDPRFLDGDLDGAVVLDMGADEHTPLRLTMSPVGGTGGPGEGLAIGVTGTAGLTTVLGVGPPGGLFQARAGVLFLDPATARFRLLGASPTQVELFVPSGVPVGVPWVFQAWGTDGTAQVVTNPIVRTF